MAENSKIQWTTHTFNPWRGCSKVAPGCANCYADAQSKRNPKVLGIWGENGTRVVASEAMWREPLKWNKAAENVAIEASQHNHRFAGDLDVGIIEPRSPRVFSASLADVFEDWGGEMHDSKGRRVWVERAANAVDGFFPELPQGSYAGCRPATINDVRGRLFRLIDSTPNLDWLLLTKRPENIRRMVPAFFPGGYIAEAGRMNQEGPRQNLWLGTSIACQEDADRNIPELLACRDLATVLFLSIEPLIGPVDLSLDPHPGMATLSEINGWERKRIDWVIVGGESGPKARPCKVEWIRSIVRQCRDAKVPCFVKQLGAMIIDRNDAGFDAEWNDNKGWPSSVGVVHNPNGYREEYQGAPAIVRTNDKKGGDPDEWPEGLRVRQFPGEAI